MVILEYGSLGNVRNFLKKNRNKFTDQILPNDTIDPKITSKQNRQTSNNNRRWVIPTTVVFAMNFKYLNFSNTNRSTEPTANSDRRSVTTTDLLFWSFQVTRAMQHLTSHKILNGNLSAENIMLCDDNVVKISNFGLTQSLYKTVNNIGTSKVSKNHKFSTWMSLWFMCFIQICRQMNDSNGWHWKRWKIKNTAFIRMCGHLELYFGNYFHLAVLRIPIGIETLIAKNCTID